MVDLANAPLAAPSRRFLQFLLDSFVLTIPFTVGFYLGRLIWSPTGLSIVLGVIGIAASTLPWREGRTVGMAVTGLVAVREDSRTPARLPAMGLRQLIVFGTPYLISQLFTAANPVAGAVRLIWFALCFLLLWSDRRQQVWDRVAHTQVVDTKADPDLA